MKKIIVLMMLLIHIASYGQDTLRSCSNTVKHWDVPKQDYLPPPENSTNNVEIDLIFIDGAVQVRRPIYRNGEVIGWAYTHLFIKAQEFDDSVAYLTLCDLEGINYNAICTKDVFLVEKYKNYIISYHPCK